MGYSSQCLPGPFIHVFSFTSKILIVVPCLPACCSWKAMLKTVKENKSYAFVLKPHWTSVTNCIQLATSLKAILGGYSLHWADWGRLLLRHGCGLPSTPKPFLATTSFSKRQWGAVPVSKQGITRVGLTLTKSAVQNVATMDLFLLSKY